MVDTEQCAPGWWLATRLIGNIIKEKVVVFLARSLREADDGGDAHDIVEVGSPDAGGGFSDVARMTNASQNSAVFSFFKT